MKKTATTFILILNFSFLIFHSHAQTLYQTLLTEADSFYTNGEYMRAYRQYSAMHYNTFYKNANNDTLTAEK